MCQFARGTLVHVVQAAQVRHRARQNERQITLQCTAIPSFVWPSASQQYSVSSSQPLRLATGAMYLASSCTDASCCLEVRATLPVDPVQVKNFRQCRSRY